MINAIRSARRSAGLTQRALAERIRVDPQVVKRLEQGVGSMASLLAAMAAVNVRLSGLGPGRTLPEQLKALRKKRALSLSRLATRAGIARGTLAALERGQGSVTSLMRLLEVLAPKVRRRAEERAYWGQGDKEDRDSRFTPPDFLEGVHAAFGEIGLDPCGHPLSPVVAHRRICLSQGGDGLTEDWSGRLAFVNPPYSELLKWLRRAHEQWKAGAVGTIVCLVPVRTDAGWFHDTLSADADIFLLRGRVRFLDLRGRGQHTPFSLMLLTLGTTREQRDRYASLSRGSWLPARKEVGPFVA